LDSSLINQINLYIEKNNSKNFSDIKNLNLGKEEIKIDNESYYQSNAIARASKTMLQCMSSKTNSKITATKD